MNLRALLAYAGSNAAGLVLISCSWFFAGGDSAARTAVFYLVGALLSHLLFAWLTWRGKL